MLCKSAIGMILVATVVSLGAQDWPQWRGPNRDGKSSSEDLISSWPDDGPPLAWQATGLGAGYSSLSISAGRIFTMGDIDGKQQVIALDERDGRTLWKTPIGRTWEDIYAGPRATPTVDGSRIYTMGSHGDLAALEAETGEIVWQKSLTRDFSGRMMSGWKFAESPLVDGDRVVVTPGGSRTALVSLDKNTGEQIWGAQLPELRPAGRDGAGYSSIVISEACGVRQYVQLMGRGVVGIAAEDGRFLWGYNRVANTTANITTPVVHENYVFASTSYGTGSVLLELQCSGNNIRARQVYFLDASTLQNHHGGLIYKDGFLYAGTGLSRGFPVCIEFETGKVRWGPLRNGGSGSAAITYADGHLYFRYQDGTMILVEANPDRYVEKGTFLIPRIQNFSWSHPVIANGKLYLREQGDLYAHTLR